MKIKKKKQKKKKKKKKKCRRRQQQQKVKTKKQIHIYKHILKPHHRSGLSFLENTYKTLISRFH